MTSYEKKEVCIDKKNVQTYRRKDARTLVQALCCRDDNFRNLKSE